MDTLGDFIRENRHSFDSKEPSSEHFDRFRQRQSAKRQKHRTNLYLIAAAAAIVGFILSGTLGILINRDVSFPGVWDNNRVAESSELQEIENYYQALIKKKSWIIREMVQGSYPEMEGDINQTLKEFDSNSYKQGTDSRWVPGNERVKNAVVKEYQTKIEVLDQIIRHLNGE